MANQKRTADDAIAQLDLARYGSLLSPRGNRLTGRNLDYLRTLARKAREWADALDREAAHIEARERAVEEAS